jgi:hypothetical protein
MSKYKKTKGFFPKGEGYEYLENANIKAWYLDGEFHNEDGPASIVSAPVPEGGPENFGTPPGMNDLKAGDILEVSEWRLNGVIVDPEEIDKVQKCPLSELPLYLNTPYASIAKRRLEEKDKSKCVICGKDLEPEDDTGVCVDCLDEAISEQNAESDD